MAVRFLDRKAEICILFWLASNGEDIGEVRLMGAKTSQSPTFYSPLLVIRVMSDDALIAIAVLFPSRV